MKKIYIALFILFSSASFAQEAGSVIIYDFENTARARDIGYFSLIVPESVSKSLLRLKYSAVRISGSIAPLESNDAGFESFMEKMKFISSEKSADYVITGSFVKSGNVLEIRSYIFVRRTGRLFKITAKQQVSGPFIGSIIEDVAGKTSAYIDRYIPRMTSEPLLQPASEIFVNSGTVEIKPQADETELYYTLDGSDPDMDKNSARTKKYSQPLVIKSDTLLKAYAVRDGWYPSGIVSGSYKIAPKDSSFIASVMVGRPVFLGNAGKEMSRTGSVMASLKLDFSLPAMGISPMKNCYLHVQGDSLAAKSDSSSGEVRRNNAYGGVLGLMYQIRLGRYLRIEPDFGVGYAYASSVSGGSLAKSLFVVERNDSTKGVYLNSSLSSSVFIGKVSFGISATYRVYYFDSEKIQMMGYCLQAGIRF